MKFDTQTNQAIFNLFVEYELGAAKLLKEKLLERIDDSGSEQATKSILRTARKNAILELGKEFTEDISYLEDYIKQNLSSQKDDSNMILRETNGEFTLQSSLVNAEADALLDMLGDLSKSFQRILKKDPTNMLNSFLTKYGAGKKQKITEVDDVISEYFRIRGRKIDAKKMAKILFEGLEVPKPSDVTVTMGYGQKFQENKKAVLDVFEASSPEMKKRIAVFRDVLEKIEGMDSDKDIANIEKYKLSAETLIGDKNLKLYADRKAVYKFWEKYGKNGTEFADFKAALEELQSTGVFKTLDKFKAEDLLYVFPIKVGDYEYDEQWDMGNKPVSESQLTMSKLPVRAMRMLDSFMEDMMALEQRQEDDIDVNPDGTAFTGVQESGAQRTLAEASEIDIPDEVEDDIEEYMRNLDKFKTTQNVDPLFRYIYQYRSNLFKESPILEAEIKEFRRIIKKEVRVVYQLDLDDEINDWLDEVLDTAREYTEDAIVYLPISEYLPDLATSITDSDISDKRKALVDFLNAIADILVSDKSTGVIRQKEASLRLASTVAEENKLSDSNAKVLNRLVQQIRDYIILPLEGVNYPFAGGFDLSEELDSDTRKLYATITSGAFKDEDAYFAIIDRELRDTAFLDISVMERLAILLTEATEPKAIKSADKARNLTSLLEFIVDEVYDGSQAIEEQGKQELGAYYHAVLDKNEISTEGKKIFDEDVDEYKDKEGADVMGPVKSLLRHIILREDSYKEKDETFAQAGKKTTFQEEIKIIKEGLASMNTVKSDTEQAILSAHDSIRKMIGKPVFYNTSKVDNYNHVNTAMSVLKSDYNLDITAIELENIVNDFGSMEDIAVKYGVSPESVYYLKANFR